MGNKIVFRFTEKCLLLFGNLGKSSQTDISPVGLFHVRTNTNAQIVQLGKFDEVLCMIVMKLYRIYFCLCYQLCVIY